MIYIKPSSLAKKEYCKFLVCRSIFEPNIFFAGLCLHYLIHAVGAFCSLWCLLSLLNWIRSTIVCRHRLLLAVAIVVIMNQPQPFFICHFLFVSFYLAPFIYIKKYHVVNLHYCGWLDTTDYV